MKKMILVIAVALMVGLPLVLAGTVSAVDAPVKVKLENDAAKFKGGKKTKTAVEFNHKKHVEEIKIACLECHHKDDEAKLKAGDKPKACLSDGCHGPKEEVVDGKKKVDAEDAFHKNCKDCHKKEKKGPKKCKECHPGASDE